MSLAYPSLLRAGPARARALYASASAASGPSRLRPLRCAYQPVPAYGAFTGLRRHTTSTPVREQAKGPGAAPPVGRTSVGSAASASASASAKPASHDHNHTPPHTHDHGHTHGAAASDSHEGHDHKHGIFHTHAHDHHEGAEQIIQAFRTGQLDRGTKITLLGLASNVALTISKGLAGLWMNSASLLAEAGHSLSDLLGDFVTLATWRISRKPPSDRFPWGYAKFETFGTLAVSVILVGGAIGIGLHSYHLLLQAMMPWLESLPPDSVFAGLQHWLPNSVPSPLLEMFHAHGVGAQGHEHAHALAADGGAHGVAQGGAILNPHAAWFALASVLVKEWLYQLTNKVAKEEHSPVLKANALHHRADALTSLVALGSIVGSSLGGYTWLDPLGGIAVSFFILQQGLSLTKVATMEFFDVGIDARTKKSIEDLVNGMVDGKELLACRNVRGVKSGGQILLDLTIVVPAAMTVRDSHALEIAVRDNIMGTSHHVREVKVHVHGQEKGEPLAAPARNGTPVKAAEGTNPAEPVKPNGTNSDFTRDHCE